MIASKKLHDSADLHAMQGELLAVVEVSLLQLGACDLTRC